VVPPLLVPLVPLLVPLLRKLRKRRRKRRRSPMRFVYGNQCYCACLQRRKLTDSFHYLYRTWASVFSTKYVAILFLIKSHHSAIKVASLFEGFIIKHKIIKFLRILCYVEEKKKFWGTISYIGQKQ
jgi:hypothetical protein